MVTTFLPYDPHFTTYWNILILSYLKDKVPWHLRERDLNIHNIDNLLNFWYVWYTTTFRNILQIQVKGQSSIVLV